MLAKRLCRAFTDLATGAVYQGFIDGKGACFLPTAGPPEGAVIQDSADNLSYFITWTSPVIHRGRAKYFQAEVHKANATITVTRPSAPERPAVVLPAYLEPTKALQDDSGPDRQHVIRRYRILVPKADIAQNDRLTAGEGQLLRVIELSPYTHRNLLVIIAES